jgi:phosphate/sulfate permease
VKTLNLVSVGVCICVYAGWHSFPYGWFCLLLRNIIFAWVVTVPIATGLSALMMVILKAVAL